jgi:hypothetical protein
LLATSEISVRYQNNRKLVESLLIDSPKSTEEIIPENAAPYVLIRFDNYASVYELPRQIEQTNICEFSQRSEKTFMTRFRSMALT